jgi:hypothetical protein
MRSLDDVFFARSRMLSACVIFSLSLHVKVPLLFHFTRCLEAQVLNESECGNISLMMTSESKRCENGRSGENSKSF